MEFLWIIMPLLVLMAGSFGEGPSKKSKRSEKVPKNPKAPHSDWKEMKEEDIEKRTVMYEQHFDIQDIDNRLNGALDLIQTQTWEIAFMSTPEIVVPLPQIYEFYHTLEKVNEGYYKAKIGKHDFHLRAGQIAEFLGVPDDGDKTYFDNMPLENLLTDFVGREDLDGIVVHSGTILKNPMNSRDLTKMAFVFWEIIASNILPQVGYLSELSSYAVYTLWRILSGRRINLPSLILNHMWRNRNQQRACLPFGRLLSALILRARPDVERRATTTLPFKTITYNSFFNKFVGRDNKKRKEDASTSREEPQQEDEHDWIDELELDEDEETPAPLQEQHDPPPSRTEWNQLCSRMDHISIGMDELRRNQEVLIRNLGTHFNFPMSDFTFHYPPPSRFPPQDPPEGDEGEP